MYSVEARTVDGELMPMWELIRILTDSNQLHH
jgi:hypothetical protein